MTYNLLGNSPGTMMGYGLMALHYLYGHRANRTGDDTYGASRAALDQYRLGTTLFINPSTATKQAIWDSGGFNTLDLSTLTGSASGVSICSRLAGSARAPRIRPRTSRQVSAWDTATLTVTDNRGGKGTATAAVTVNPAPLVNMWITAISCQALAQGKNKYARVTVTVRDANGHPVSGAVVTGQWSGAHTGTGCGTTASNGTVSIDSAKLKPGGTATFTQGLHGPGTTTRPRKTVRRA